MSLHKNIGSYIDPRAAGAPIAVTAGGAGDGVEQNGAYISRGSNQSCEVIIGWSTTLAAAETLTIVANLQDATSGAGAGVADFGAALASAIQETGAETAKVGQVSFELDLGSADEFIRLQFTATMSAADTDVAIVWGAIIFGGGKKRPA